VLRPEARIARIAERQHSVFTTEQARASGLSAAAVQRRVDAGCFARIYRTVLHMRGGALTYEGRVLAAVLATGNGASASHVTAGRLLHLDDVVANDLHVTVADGRRVRIPGVVIHRPRRVTKRDFTRIGVIPATSPGLTLIDLSGVLSEPALENAIDDARRRELVYASSLLRRVEAMDARGRRGIPLLRSVLRERVGEPIPGSKWETRLKELLVSHGLPLPIAQFEIHAPDHTFVGRPDLVYPQARLFIEFEGYAFHSSRIAWEDGIARQNELVALGWVPLRVTKRQMEHAPLRIIDLVSGRLISAGVIPRPQMV